MARGEPMPAERAHSLGRIDELIDGDPRGGAIALAERLVAEGRALRRLSAIDDKLEAARRDPGLFDRFRQEIERRARGYLAPFKCIEAVRAAVTLPFAEGLRRERELFLECLASPQSRAQIHAFFAEREATKIPDVPRDTPARPIGTAAVIGAGTMGGGIAMTFANAGIPVAVVEASGEALDRGLAVVRKNYAATVEKGRLTPAEMERRLALLRGTLDWEAVAHADIAGEAALQALAVKAGGVARRDRRCTAP